MEITPTLRIRKVAVLGAGVMGAQIAAHLVNVVPTLLFDLPAPEGDKNGVVLKAIAGLKKLKPTPLAIPDSADDIIPANYELNLAWLKDCDLIIEAIAERIDLKENLYQKIAPYLNEHAVFVTNTSGLSITSLASVFPENLRARFCGVHFFNPPRYMHLVEIIPHEKTDRKMLPELETFLVSTLGKSVIYAKDTPNFIANRVGVFSILATLYHAQQLNIPLEVVDALTGSIIGRPKSATLRTADVVGLDTLAHVIKTLTDNLPNDPWTKYYQTPVWLQELIQQGALGQKSGVGVYKKTGKDIFVWDINQKKYRLADQQADQEVITILKIKNQTEKFSKLRESNHPQAQFLLNCFRDLFHYAAVHAQDIAETVRDVDLAMRWGFGWQLDVFEFWQSIGWQTVAQFIETERIANNTMAAVDLPEWVNKNPKGVYTAEGAYSPTQNIFLPRSKLAVYQKQRFINPVLGETADEGKVIFENDAARLWHDNDGVAILSFKTKLNTINNGVLDSIFEAIKTAEKDYKGLIIWQRHGDNFSAGANLAEVDIKNAEQLVKKFQDAALAIRYAQIPVVAAIRGLALGGSCELSLHCAHRVAAFETYIGLPEIGVGLLPAGGGLKELALRAAQEANGDDPFHNVQKYFKQVAMGEISSSAIDAKQKNYLRVSDTVVMNADEILFVAKQQILALTASNYHPPLSARFPVVGIPGIATILMQLVNMREGGFISNYDYLIASKIAEVICGSKVVAGSMVDENWILRLEREAILELIANDKTQERIKYMLVNGKPLRN
jgi:3-hydroxyacyl-CoA dehydrogenase